MLSDRDELIWAAGFFDGEGSTCTWTSPNGKKHRLQIQITQSVGEGEYLPETLERFRDAVGIGKIYGPYEGKKSTHRASCYYTVYGENADIVIEKIWPYISSIKRRQIEGMRVRLAQLWEDTIPPT